MPGIPFLDNATSYTFAKILDVFIRAGIPLFTVVSAGVAFADWKAWRPKSTGKRILKWIINLVVFGLCLFCIAYGIDGRYAETEVGDHGNTSYYYFGQAKNGVRFGFGKMYDNDKNIYMMSDAKGNKTYENAKRYNTVDGITYLSYEGNYVNGNREGYGKSYKLYSGEPSLIYDGFYHNDLHTDIGTEYTHYPSGVISSTYVGMQLEGEFNGNGVLRKFDENGNLTYYYSGGWAKGKKCGYGVEMKIKEGIVIDAYRGTYWDDKRWGEGINEYYNDVGTHVICNGYSNDGKQQEDCAYYDGKGTFWPTEFNGSYVKNENDELVQDIVKTKELMERWPFPGELYVGKSSEEFEDD